MSDHLATLKFQNRRISLVDFGRPVWFEVSKDGTPEMDKFRLIPNPNFEIREALIYFFSNELGLENHPTNLHDSEFLEMNELLNDQGRLACLAELVATDLSQVELVLVDAGTNEFEMDLVSFATPPIVRRANSEDLNFSVSPFGSIFRGLKDIHQGNVRGADYLIDE